MDAAPAPDSRRRALALRSDDPRALAGDALPLGVTQYVDVGIPERQLRHPPLDRTRQAEGKIRDLEQKYPSGRTVHEHLVSDAGRVYLLLAHASGRLR